VTVWREGSATHAAFLAYKCALALGYVGLKLRLIEAIARHGGNCWRANSDLAKQLGSKWKSSIWRAAHQLKADRLLRIVRVLPGRRPDGAKKRKPCGTSNKYLDFRRLGCPEAVEDWRRPDTATREAPQRPPAVTYRREDPPERPAPAPAPPAPEPQYLIPAEAQAAAAAAIAALAHPKR